MKYNTQNGSNAYRATQERYRFPILVLAGILFLSTSLTLLAVACADPLSLQSDGTQKNREELISQEKGDRLPSELVDAVRQDLSLRTGVSSEKLKVIEASRETWPDGCLGLAKPDEFCIQMLVEGWRVVVSDGSQTWVYRTDGEGSTIRLRD
ncbi:MAG: hypothetical protein AB4426_29415 [Xenococcaceae cyanobacterium]